MSSEILAIAHYNNVNVCCAVGVTRKGIRVAGRASPHVGVSRCKDDVAWIGPVVMQAFPDACPYRKFCAAYSGCHTSKRIVDSHSVRPCLSLVNEIRRCTRLQESTVRTQISKPQGEAARSVVDAGVFRQPVVRSGGAVHQPAAPTRRTPFPAAESHVAPASPSPTKDVFSIGDSNRNTN